MTKTLNELIDELPEMYRERIRGRYLQSTLRNHHTMIVLLLNQNWANDKFIQGVGRMASNYNGCQNEI